MCAGGDGEAYLELIVRAGLAIEADQCTWAVVVSRNIGPGCCAPRASTVDILDLIARKRALDNPR